MKKSFALIFIFTLLYGNLHAQKRTFLRVYSIAGNKINKGKFYDTTDSSLLLYKDSTIKEILVFNIGYIKTRRSLGHNILVGALVGAIPASIIGSVGGESKVNNNTLGGVLHDALTFTPAEGALAGLIIGSIGGAATGAIISAFTKHITFTINGDASAWQLERRKIDLLPSGK